MKRKPRQKVKYKLRRQVPLDNQQQIATRLRLTNGIKLCEKLQNDIQRKYDEKGVVPVLHVDLVIFEIHVLNAKHAREGVEVT